MLPRLGSIVLFAFFLALADGQAPKLVVQTGHSGGICSVAFSPDGKILASGSSDRTIVLWEVKTRRQIRSLQGHTGYVLSVAFSPDGKLLASGSNDGTVKLWNVVTGEVEATSRADGSEVSSVAFSPDGETLAAGTWGKTVTLWDVRTGHATASLVGHTGGIQAVTFSPDGKTIASADDDGSIRLWSVETGKQTGELLGHTGQIWSVAFSPDGALIASAGEDKTVKLWDVEGRREIKSLAGHGDAVHTVAFSPDGLTLASGGKDKTIKLWDVAKGREIRSLNGHSDEVESVRFSPDGSVLASGAWDNDIDLWDITAGRISGSFKRHIDQSNSLAVSPDGKTLALGRLHTIRLWDFETGNNIKILALGTKPLGSIAFSSDSKFLASGGWDGVVRLWDVATGAPITSFEADQEKIDAVAFSPDGNYLASGADKGISIWDLRSRRRVTMGASDVSSVAFSPDNKTLASGSYYDGVTLWSVATGERLGEIPIASETVTLVAFSSDGTALAVSAWPFSTFLMPSPDIPRRLRFYSVSTRQLLSTVDQNDPKTFQLISPWVPAVYQNEHSGELLLAGEKFHLKLGDSGEIDVIDHPSGGLLGRFIPLDTEDWVAVDPLGRFDTNKPLDNIDGLYWLLPDRPFSPLSLDLFVRQYYAPGLLSRIIHCSRDGTCSREFPPVPPITTINRVQPGITLR